MFNFFCSLFLALAIVAALGTQLATTAYRNKQLPQCADCQVNSQRSVASIPGDRGKHRDF
jgi:hypothetical protein